MLMFWGAFNTITVWERTNSIKLAIEKRYRSRSGQVTTPLFQTPGDNSISRLQPFAGYFVDDDKEGYRTWSEEGESVNGWIMDRDLVEEISEPDQR
jgi:hypothetical protein